ncbi:hypothetical protein BGZ99_001701, partial [Dissophora globulifera]
DPNVPTPYFHSSGTTSALNTTTVTATRPSPPVPLSSTITAPSSPSLYSECLPNIETSKLIKKLLPTRWN